ncbi:MAG: HlyD family secretion protein, partial [Flavobacteriales bacterium]
MKLMLWTGMMAAVVLASCGKGKDQEVQPSRQAITETVFASGQLDARDRYNLTAQSEGYLVELNVEEGDSVTNGQVLAVINNISNEANSAAAGEQLKIAEYNLSMNAPAYKEAAANLELAETKLAQENKQLNRYKELHKQGSVSDLDLENATIAYTTAETNAEAARERLKLIQQQAKQAEITQRAQQQISASNRQYNELSALSNGTILKRHKQRGDYVRKGDVILTIANEATVIAKLNVDENSIGKVAVGMPVKVRLNTFKDQILDAKVSL